MAAPRALVVLVSTFLLAASSRASKYSREANEGLAAAGAKRRETGEFRVVRLNQIWEKAQRVSGVRGGTRGGWRGSGPAAAAGAGRCGRRRKPGDSRIKSRPCFARSSAWGQALGCCGLSPGFRPGCLWWAPGSSSRSAPSPGDLAVFSQWLVSLFCRVYLCYRSMPARHYIQCLANKWKTVKSLRYQGVSQTVPYTCTLNALPLLMAMMCSSCPVGGQWLLSLLRK